MKKKYFKFLSSILSFILAFFSVFFADEKISYCANNWMIPRTAELNAYSKMLQKKKLLNEKNDDFKTCFCVCDLDANGIYELIISEDFNLLSKKEYYTYENGKVINLKAPSDEENYPVYGSLYLISSRGSYAFYRGGPAFDDENGNGCMPYNILEYKIKNHQIQLINSFACLEYNTGKKSGTNEYYWNGLECKEKDYNNIYHNFDKEIKFYPNSRKNRNKLGVASLKEDDGSNKAKVGKQTLIKNLKYKITKINKNGTGEVSLIGIKKKKNDASFTSLKIANSIKINGKNFKISSIEKEAFLEYKYLSKVEIGTNVKQINSKAFYGCNKLQILTIKSSLLKKGSIKTNAFAGVSSKMDVKVPKAKVSSYRNILKSGKLPSTANIHS